MACRASRERALLGPRGAAGADQIRSFAVTSGRVLLIDNVDSFTFNIADLLHRVAGDAPTVWRNDRDADAADLAAFDAIVIGPGPGRPQRAEDMGLSIAALEQRDVPVLGICLGHQGMAHLAGDDVVELADPMHGRVSRVFHDGIGILRGVPSPFHVVRYHSLEVIAGASVLRPLAWAADDGCVMVLADPDRRRYGVQFHPESVLSQHGERIVANFLGEVAGIPVVADRTEHESDRGPVAVGDAPRAHRAAIRDGSRRLDGLVRHLTVRAELIGQHLDAVTLAETLMGGQPAAVWLDSSPGEREQGGARERSRFSALAVPDGPLGFRLTHRVGEGSTIHRADASTEHRGGRLVGSIRELMDTWRVDDRADEDGYPAPFRPGFVGYLGYELRAETTTASPPRHRATTPDASFLFVDRAIVLDHHTANAYAIWLTDSEIDAAQQRWLTEVRELADRIAAPGPGRIEVPATTDEDAHDIDIDALLRHSREEYLGLIARCQQYIRAGESYEMCLTNAVRWPARVGERRLYSAIRRTSPVPFGTWLRTPEVSVLGSSPERFVSVTAEGTVQARPIKGTRPRDPDPAVDVAHAADLAASVKDRAENLMIVDLLRNDLHRVCRSGSVRVPELFAVESYSTVHQLVSTITGELAEGMTAVDVLESCFPGGSMTGAPKVRTTELLEELEGSARGVYSGALGWIGVNGAMDTSIVIRTATWVDGQVEFGIGGAITVLSDPEEEYAETVDKARALVRALASVG